MILSRNRNYSRLVHSFSLKVILRIIRPAPEASARLKPAGAQKQRRMQKQSHHPPWSIRFPLFLIQNTPQRREFLAIHI